VRRAEDLILAELLAAALLEFAIVAAQGIGLGQGARQATVGRAAEYGRTSASAAAKRSSARRTGCPVSRKCAAPRARSLLFASCKVVGDDGIEPPKFSV
jgi:hypothetical protein